MKIKLLRNIILLGVIVFGKLLDVQEEQIHGHVVLRTHGLQIGLGYPKLKKFGCLAPGNVGFFQS